MMMMMMMLLLLFLMIVAHMSDIWFHFWSDFSEESMTEFLTQMKESLANVLNINKAYIQRLTVSTSPLVQVRFAQVFVFFLVVLLMCLNRLMMSQQSVFETLLLMMLIVLFILVCFCCCC